MNTETTTRISKSPLTGKEYILPDTNDDRAGIDAFLAKHPGKKLVVIQGMGFVGSVMGLVVANALTEEYAVIGIDLASPGSYWKIRSINEGQFPVQASDPRSNCTIRSPAANRTITLPMILMRMHRRM